MPAPVVAALVVYGAVVVALLAVGGVVDWRREEQRCTPTRRPVRELGWCSAQARDRRDRVDPGASWVPLGDRRLPDWARPSYALRDPAAGRVIDVRIPAAARLSLDARCRWHNPTCSATVPMEAIR
ncbi:MAG: hypothetical protein ACRD0W_09655 [Acidimicrobiales bacterium]